MILTAYQCDGQGRRVKRLRYAILSCVNPECMARDGRRVRLANERGEVDRACSTCEREMVAEGEAGED